MDIPPACPWILDQAMPDGRRAIIYPLTYDRARLGIGSADVEVFDDEW